ncbi:MAG TPA: CNNM domain-containing protein [Planctomycetota bacterium]|nr:CNNM domain-containing protein [Planctomycetota bacterium]
MLHLIADNGVWLALQAVLVIASGLTSGTETAIFSLTDEDRVQLERTPTLFTRAVLRLYEQRDRLIVTLLTINMSVNISYFAIVHKLTGDFATGLVQEHLLGSWLTYATAWSLLESFGLVVLLVFGEVVPKLFASGRYRAFAEVTALPYSWLHSGLILIGVTPLLRGITRWLEAKLPMPAAQPGEHGLDADEIREAVNRTAGLSNEDKQRLRALFSLSYLKVSAILVPRVDVLFARAGMPIEQALDLAVLHAVRVLPVKGQSSDDIRGAVYLHDMLFHQDKTRPVDEIVRPCMFFPEVASVESFITALGQANTNFAVIVDEYGGASGVASLDDALELVLGEFEDENAALSVGWQEAQGKVRLDGGFPLHQFRERLEGRAALVNVDWSQMDLPDVDTVGGFMQHKTGKSPEVGQSVFWQNLVFRVLSVHQNRIRLMEVRLPGAAMSGRYKSQAFNLPGGRS